MLVTKLSRILGEKRISQSKLAQMSNVSPTTIHLVYHDGWRQIHRSTVEKICSALNVDISELFEMTDDD